MKKMAAAGGERLSSADAGILRAALPHVAIEALLQIESALPLAGATLELPAYQDPSGIGVCMKWMPAKVAAAEATDFAPGMQAASFGLVPVGECLMGSGAPYFIDTRHEGLPIVRLPHDAVDTETDALDESRIERVAESLELFFDQCSLQAPQ